MRWKHIMDSQPKNGESIIQIDRPYEGHYSMGMRNYVSGCTQEEYLKWCDENNHPYPDFWWVSSSDFPFPDQIECSEQEDSTLYELIAIRRPDGLYHLKSGKIADFKWIIEPELPNPEAESNKRESLLEPKATGDAWQEKCKEKSELNKLTKWISLKDKTPELNLRVLCINSFGEAAVCSLEKRWSSEESKFWINDSFEFYPSFWMPIPDVNKLVDT